MKIDYEYADNCPLCGGEGKFYRNGGDPGEFVSTDKCQECGVIYQNPRMTRESLDEYYSKGNYHIEHPSTLVAEGERTMFFLKILKAMEILPYRALDIGCGRGLLLKNLRYQFGTEIVGMEKRILPGTTMKNILHGKEDIQGKFDLIFCIQTLEHMYDPQAELRWMAEKLEPGGTIIIDLPLDGKMYLPHVFVFDILSAKLMLNRLGLNYLHLDYPKRAIFLIGDDYHDMKSERVIENVSMFTLREGVYQ